MSATANKEVGHYAAPDFTGRDEKRLSYYRPAAIESRSKARLERIGWMVQEVADAKSAIVKAAAETKDDPAPLSALDIAQERYQDCREQGLTDRKEIRDRLLPDVIAAFATVAKETVGYEPRELQYQAATLLYEGNGKKGLVADIKTGEGKTITTALTATMFAVDGQSVHVATRNDYLAKRDAEQMGAIYAQLGLKVGVIQSTGETYIYDQATGQLTAAPHRSDAYACDVVYGVGTEFGFDYLRDNTALSKDQLRQVRGRAHLVVDEADDVMVNQATTPLIIQKATESSPTQAPEIALEIEGKSFTFQEITDFMAEFVADLHEGHIPNPGNYAKQFLDLTRKGQLGDLLTGKVKLQDRKKVEPSGDFIASYVNNEAYLTPHGLRLFEQALGHLVFGETKKGPQIATIIQQAPDGSSIKTAINGPDLKIHGYVNIFQHFKDQPEILSELMLYLQNALKAECFYRNGEDYQLIAMHNPQTGETWEDVVLMDTATLGGGRPLFGRQLDEGLHAAIQAKERRVLPPAEKDRIHLTPPTGTSALTTFQNYFSLYETLAGMTGTATYAAQEFYRAYGTDVVMIPRHTESKLVTHPDKEVIFLSKAAQFEWMANEVKRRYLELDATKLITPSAVQLIIEGKSPEEAKTAVEEAEKASREYRNQSEYQRPILIGLQTPEDVQEFYQYLFAELVSFTQAPLEDQHFLNYLQTHHADMLKPENAEQLQTFTQIIIDNMSSTNIQWLTGENSKKEEELIANAGKLNTITITCMIGRGTDIKLGGQDSTVEDHRLVNDRGGLYIIGEHGSPESDEQLAGRGARWEDEGEVIFVTNAESVLIKRAHGATFAREFQEKLIQDGSTYIDGAKARQLIREWQAIVVKNGVESRRQLMDKYEVYNQQRNVLYADREKILTAGELDTHTGALMELMVDDIISEYEQKRHNSPYTDTDGLAEELLTYIADVLPLRVFQYSKQKQLVQLVRVANGNPMQPTSLRDMLDQLSPQQRRLLSEGNLRQLLLPFFEEAYVSATVQREQEALATIKAADTRDSIVIRQFHQNEATRKVLENERQTILEAIDTAWSEQLELLKSVEQARWLQQPMPTQLSGFNGSENPDVWYAREAAAVFEQTKKYIRRQIVHGLLH